MNPLVHSAFTCSRCRRSTATPFGSTSGLCLRCAGERALALDLDEPADSAADSTDAAHVAVNTPPPPPGAPPLPPAPPAAAATSAPLPSGALPERIGPYEIIDEIGRGGMACVFAARQPRLDRLVALKVLFETPANAALAPRFLREAQTVARLRHPHIVAVHDSGRTDHCVYFTMDYLEGGDLARRMRETPLTPRAAATLIEKVAGALAYAHAEGVLHRDLKPSNILLDGDEPRLADFGLAAQLEPGGDLTAVSAILGTPHYLAPEAVRGGSGAQVAASDLYALGTVLYELLAGRTPFAGATPVELPALLQETEPPPLRLLAPATPPDLETICLHCLEREPARRYANAAALAADLRRFLAGEPILARPPGSLARFARFSRRHRTAFAVTGGVGAALLAGAVVSTALAVRATRAEHRAATEAETARAFADFLQRDILLQAAPSGHPDRDLKLRTVLDTAAARIDGRFAAQPAVEAALRATLGETYHSLGEYPAAAAHLEKALALRRRLGPDDAETWRLRSRLARTLSAQSDYTAAAAHLGAALVAQRDALGLDHPDTLASTLTLARVYHGQDKLALALTLRREVVARRTTRLGAEHPDTLEAVDLVAVTLLDLGQFPEAVTLLEPNYHARRRVLGPDSPATLESLNNLAGAYWALGRLGEAEPLFREAIAIGRRLLGPAHPDTATTINNLAYVVRSQGKWADAATLYEEALAAYRRALGPDHHDAMRTMGALAVVYQQLGRLDEARALLEQTVEIGARTLGSRHPEVASARDLLGAVLVASGDFSAAETILRTALADHLAIDERPTAGYITRSILGGALVGLQRHAEAETELLASHHGMDAIADKLTPTQKRGRRDTLGRLVTLYRAWGKPAEAAVWEERLAAASAEK